MKTLYVSDLDGTLLNKNATLSNNTIEIINCLIAKGMNFTFATARTAETAIKMTNALDITLPVVLMNGVCTYDIKNKVYLNVEHISPVAITEIISILKLYNETGFFYSINDGRIHAYYENLDKPHMRAFHNDRVLRFGKPFVKVETFIECISTPIIYYSMADRQDILQPLYDSLKNISGINIEYYRDIYEPNFWYLEICSDKASKYKAVNYIRKLGDFDNIVSFGDNLNDIPLFKASDRSFAVKNAKPEVIKAATDVISSNENDGVAIWLSENFEV